MVPTFTGDTSNAPVLCASAMVYATAGQFSKRPLILVVLTKLPAVW